MILVKALSKPAVAAVPYAGEGQHKFVMTTVSRKREINLITQFGEDLLNSINLE